MEFSLKESLIYAKKGKIDGWAHEFLNNEGSNVKLSKIMKDKGYWLGPFEVPLNKLVRCCGPEKNMKFYEEKEKFYKHVASIIEKFKAGWNMPPFIAWYLDGKLSLADGSHRIEALRKLGFKKYFTIMWFEKPPDFKKYKKMFDKTL